ncbi:cysteinyl leukotriene receptor 1-like [Genypterus blacodes]|uniref:cysteinyl leukotriene receptor 1-like n=1 Tax=Genypterus blacodes TaxID=154954 RepID=UPI003F76C60F
MEVQYRSQFPVCSFRLTFAVCVCVRACARAQVCAGAECWSVHSNHTSQPSVCGHDDDAFKYCAYTITYMLLFPIAILSNTGALVVFFWKCWHRSSAFSVVMMNLALSDACFSLTLPLRLAYYFNRGIWYFPDWLCRACVYGFYLNLYTSIFFLTVLSMLRWVAVMQPLRPQVEPVRMARVCVGVWLFVGVASVPFLLNGVTQR